MMSRFCVPLCSAKERLGYLWVLDPERSLSDDGQELARQAGRDLLAVLDRSNAALRAEESAHQALLRGCSRAAPVSRRTDSAGIAGEGHGAARQSGECVRH